MKNILRYRWGLVLVGVAVLIVTFAGAGANFRGSSTASPADDAKTEALTVACFGHVDVKHGVASLYPTQPGRVAEVLVEEGQTVKKGTVLLRLEDASVKLQIAEAQADLEAARSQLAQVRKAPEQHQAKIAQMQAGIAALKERLAAAKHVSADKEDLAAKGLIRQTEMTVARDQVKEVEALLRVEEAKLAELRLHDPATDVRRAEENIAAKQARLGQAQEQLKECSLRAPTDGKVMRTLVGPGDMLGTVAKQAAVLFCPDTPRFIRAEVDQEFAYRLAIGQPATIQDDSNSSAKWTGRVSAISDWYTNRRSILQEPMQANDVRTLECLISLDPDQAPLKIGQRVRIHIETQIN